MKKIICLCLMLSAVLVSCKQEKTQLEKDRDIIQSYLSDNNIDALEHPSGLFYVIYEEGTGTEMPNINSQIEIKYKGYFSNGVVFDETTGSNTANFTLSNLIPAWQIGITLLKKGGRMSIYAPSSLGYGFFGSGGVPGNTVIFFDIELISFS